MILTGYQIAEGTWQETDGLPVYTTTYNLDGLQPSTSYQTRVLVHKNKVKN